MFSDWSPPLSRCRRSWWQRDPRLILAALAACALALLVLAGAATAGGPPRPHAVIVQPGDSLWAIAATRYPEDDVRAQVDAIESANHLGSAQLIPGQRLVLP